MEQQNENYSEIQPSEFHQNYHKEINIKTLSLKYILLAIITIFIIGIGDFIFSILEIREIEKIIQLHDNYEIEQIVNLNHQMLGFYPKKIILLILFFIIPASLYFYLKLKKRKSFYTIIPMSLMIAFPVLALKIFGFEIEDWIAEKPFSYIFSFFVIGFFGGMAYYIQKKFFNPIENSLQETLPSKIIFNFKILAWIDLISGIVLAILMAILICIIADADGFAALYAIVLTIFIAPLLILNLVFGIFSFSYLNKINLKGLKMSLIPKFIFLITTFIYSIILACNGDDASVLILIVINLFFAILIGYAFSIRKQTKKYL